MEKIRKDEEIEKQIIINKEIEKKRIPDEKIKKRQKNLEVQRLCDNVAKIITRKGDRYLRDLKWKYNLVGLNSYEKLYRNGKSL